jgi:tetratricopeptide (TPR) repeat protein
MGRIYILTLALLFAVFLTASGQGGMFNEAFKEFATSRLKAFEEIPIEWKMGGLLQADLNEGLNYLLEENAGAAEESLTTVLKKDSTIWQAYYYRGAARKQLEKYQAAEHDMRRAIRLHGDFYEGYVELAKILFFRRQPLESEKAINKSIRLDRSRGTAYYLKGDINMFQGETRSAVNNYKDCLKSDSLFHDARIKIALLDAISKKNLDAAIEHLTRVLKYDSLQKTALLFRALLIQDKDKKQSIKDLTNLLEVSPYNIMAQFYRGYFSAEVGEYENAFNDFHNVMRETSTDDNRYIGQQTWVDKKIDMQNVGAYTVTRIYGLSDEDARFIKEAYCHIITEKYDKSLITADKVSNKREPVAIYLKAVAYEHKGEHMKALQHYNVALSIDDGIADAYKKRGIYEQEMKQWDKSVADFSAVLKIYPDMYFTNRMRGVSYYHLKQFDKAIDDFSIYLRKDSLNQEVTGYRGMAYLQSNQKLKAYVDFAASGNIQAIKYSELERLIDSVIHIPDTTQALLYLEAVSENTPYYTEGFVQQFKIYMARNQWDPVAAKISRAVIFCRPNISPAKYSYLLSLRALSYAKSQQTDDALKTFNEALKLDKDNDLALLERGRLLLEMGKSSKAINDLKASASLGNKEAAALLTRIPKQ